MAPAVFSYLVGILLMANSAYTQSQFLVVVDWVCAVYFVLVGSLAGWQAARQ